MILVEHSAETIEESRKFWERRTGSPVSHRDASEAVANTVKLFDLLAEWDRAERENKLEDGEEHPSDVQKEGPNVETEHSNTDEGAAER